MRPHDGSVSPERKWALQQRFRLIQYLQSAEGIWRSSFLWHEFFLCNNPGVSLMNNQHVGQLMFLYVPTRSLIALTIKLHSFWLWKQRLAAAALCSMKTRQRQIKDIDLNNAALTDSHSSLLSCRHTSHPVARKWVMCLFWLILWLAATESFPTPWPRCWRTTLAYLHEGVSAFAHSAALQWR